MKQETQELIKGLEDYCISQNINNIFTKPDSMFYQRLHTFSDALKQNPNIATVTLSDQTLGSGAQMRGIVPEGFKQEDNKFISCIAVDFGFLETYGLKVLAGRDF